MGSGEESLFIYWLHWTLIAVRGLSLAVESRAHTLVKQLFKASVALASLLRGMSFRACRLQGCCVRCAVVAHRLRAQAYLWVHWLSSGGM